MRLLLIIAAICAAMTLSACKLTGTAGSSSGDGAISGGSSLVPPGSGDSGSGSGDGSGSGSNLPHSPEPATIALFTAGLAGLALLKRKKK